MRNSRILLSCLVLLTAPVHSTTAGNLVSDALRSVSKGAVFKAQSATSQVIEERNDAVARRDVATSSAAREAAQREIERANAELRVLSDTERYIANEPLPPERLREVKEAIRWLQRNVWVTCGSAPWMNNATASDFGPILQPHISIIQQAARATGLVKSFDLNKEGKIVRMRSIVGTAVAIGPRHIITNRHVILDGQLGYVDATDPKTMKLFSEVSGRIVFPVEYDRCQPTRQSTLSDVAITGITYVDSELDFLIAEVSAPLTTHVSFPAERDMVSGDRLVVVGYPTRPSDNETFLTPSQIDQVFRAPDGRTPFPAQRVAEGYSLPEDPDLESGYFRYDATTWSGNSGSLVISLVTGQIVGLHARGLQAETQGAGYNEAVDTVRISAAITDVGNELALAKGYHGELSTVAKVQH